MNIIIEPTDSSFYSAAAQRVMRDAQTFLHVIGMRLETELSHVPQLTELSLSLSTSNAICTWPTYRFKLAMEIPWAVMSTFHHNAEGADSRRTESIGLHGQGLDQEEMSRVIEQTVTIIVNHVKDLLKANLACHQDEVRALIGAIQSLEPTSVN